MAQSNQRVILTTKRLMLRPANKADAKSLHAAFSDPEVMKYWDSEPHATVADTEKWVDKMIASPANGTTDFIICRLSTGDDFPTGAPSPCASACSSATTASTSGPSASTTSSSAGNPTTPLEASKDDDYDTPTSPVIGKIGVWKTEGRAEVGEIGFLLARAHWRQGLVSEALAMLLPYFFERKGFERITADIDPRNEASRGLLEKFGFVVTGRREKTFFIGGEWVDSLDLALGREEYLKRRRGRA